MAQQIVDGKVLGSSGVAKAGLTLGIIGTGLAALGGGGNGIFGGLFGGGAAATAEKMANLQSTINQLTAEKYSDAKYLDIYTKLVAASEASDAKIAAVQGQLYAAVLDLDKKTALNEQAQKLNREYDNTVRDYMMTIVNNKIDCCCEKMTMKADYEKQISELADASIISYVNSNFLPRSVKTTRIKYKPQRSVSIRRRVCSMCFNILALLRLILLLAHVTVQAQLGITKSITG